MSLPLIDTSNWIHKHWNTDLEYVLDKQIELWLCDGCGYIGDDIAVSRRKGTFSYGGVSCPQCGCSFILTVAEAGNKTSMMLNKSMTPAQINTLKRDEKPN